MAKSDDRKYLTEEELKRLFSVIESPRDRAIFALMYWRGLRASEVAMIQMSAYRPKAQAIYIRRLKHSMDGEFPLSPLEQKLLRAWVKSRGTEPGPLFEGYGGKGIRRQQLWVLMRHYGELADLPEHLRHPHALKHSIATHLIAKHLEIMDVKDWLGHRAISSTLKYAEFRSKQRDEAARRVYSNL
jgi:site-specific recombinase XerD